MVLHVPVVHGGERGFGLPDGEGRSFGEDVEVGVGDDGRDLDDDVPVKGRAPSSPGPSRRGSSSWGNAHSSCRRFGQSHRTAYIIGAPRPDAQTGRDATDHHLPRGTCPTTPDRESAGRAGDRSERVRAGAPPGRRARRPGGTRPRRAPRGRQAAAPGRPRGALPPHRTDIGPDGRRLRRRGRRLGRAVRLDPRCDRTLRLALPRRRHARVGRGGAAVLQRTRRGRALRHRLRHRHPSRRGARRRPRRPRRPGDPRLGLSQSRGVRRTEADRGAQRPHPRRRQSRLAGTHGPRPRPAAGRRSGRAPGCARHHAGPQCHHPLPDAPSLPD